MYLAPIDPLGAARWSPKALSSIASAAYSRNLHCPMADTRWGRPLFSSVARSFPRPRPTSHCESLAGSNSRLARKSKTPDARVAQAMLMSNINPNCDGSHCRLGYKEVRKYPSSTGLVSHTGTSWHLPNCAVE